MNNSHRYLMKKEYSTIMSVNLNYLSANTVDSIDLNKSYVSYTINDFKLS